MVARSMEARSSETEQGHPETESAPGDANFLTTGMLDLAGLS